VARDPDAALQSFGSAFGLKIVHLGALLTVVY
jgi:hypothetical protein